MKTIHIVGSKPFTVAAADGIGTLRDAILLLLAAMAAKIGEHYFGGFDPPVQTAIAIVTFAAFKFAWKYVNDTRRLSSF